MGGRGRRRGRSLILRSLRGGLRGLMRGLISRVSRLQGLRVRVLNLKRLIHLRNVRSQRKSLKRPSSPSDAGSSDSESSSATTLGPNPVIPVYVNHYKNRETNIPTPPIITSFCALLCMWELIYLYHICW